MAWFPVSYLATYHLYQYLNNRISWNRWTTVGLLFIGSIMGLALTLLPIVGMNAAAIIPYINDPFAVANLQGKRGLARMGMDYWGALANGFSDFYSAI